MKTKLKTLFGISHFAVVVAALVCSAPGCSQQSADKSTGQSRAAAPEGKPMEAPDKMSAAPSAPAHQASADPAKKSEPPAKLEAPSKMDGAYASAPPSSPTPPPPAQAEPEPAASSDDEKRQQAEDMIYATIRIKMEEAIIERAKLLKEGRDPADERVRQLEGTIMRARDLLTEAGEVVEEVSPPIVQSKPQP